MSSWLDEYVSNLTDSSATTTQPRASGSRVQPQTGGGWLDNYVQQTQQVTPIDETEEEKKREEKEQEELTTFQSIQNSFSNLFEQIGDIGEFYGGRLGLETGAGQSADIASRALYSGIFGADESSTNEILSSLDAYEKEKAETKRTKGILESLEKGDIGGAFAGAINAITNGIGSAAYGASTFGLGFLSDYAAENYIEFNKLKAQNLNKKFDDLVREGEADVAVPLGIAAAQTAMEAFALSKVLKVVGGKGGMNPLSGFGKELATKALYSKPARTTLSILGTGSTEFVTEIGQYAAEEVNKELGRVAGTDEEANLKDTIIDAITSQEGLEAGIQGFIGGSGMAGGSYSARAVQETRRVISPGDIEEDMIRISLLENKLENTKDKTAKEGIRENLKQARVAFADKQRKVNKTYEKLTDDEILQIEDRRELADVAIAKITDLNKKLDSGQITQEEHAQAKQGFMKKYEENRNRINDIIYARDQAASETLSEETGLTVKNTKTEEEYEDALVEDQSNGEFSNKKELDDFLLKKPRKNASKKSKEKFERAKDLKARVSSISRQSTAYFAGEGSIIISEDKSKKAGDVSVNSHEVLHPILNALVGNRKEQAKIVKEVKKAATFKQRRYVAQQMRDRNISPENQDTEFLNILSDGLVKGDIDFEQGVFERIGKALASIFAAKQVKTVGFDNGQQVYNFIKEYSKGAKKGVVSDVALKAVKEAEAKSKVKIKDVQGEGVEVGVIQPTQPKAKAIETNLKDKDLSEGETIVESKKDKQGRNITSIARSSEKDGVKTTKFTFNRDDKPTSQRSAGGVSPQVAFANNYEIDSKSIPKGAKVSQVFELKESDTNNTATVEFNIEKEGKVKKVKRKVVLNKKTKGQKSKQKITEEEDKQSLLEIQNEDIEVEKDNLGQFNKNPSSLKDTIKLTDLARKEGFKPEDLGTYGSGQAIDIFTVSEMFKRKHRNKFSDKGFSDAIKQVHFWIERDLLPSEEQFLEFNKFINELPARARGKGFEEYLIETLGLVIGEKNLVTKKPTEKGGLADVVANVKGGKQLKVEAKYLTFQGSSVRINKNFGQSEFKYAKNKELPEKYTKQIKDALLEIKNPEIEFKNRAIELAGKLIDEIEVIDDIKNKKPKYRKWTEDDLKNWSDNYVSLSDKLPTVVYDALVKEKLVSKLNTSFEADEELFGELYARKGKQAPDYGEFAVKGFFYLPKPGRINENPLNIPNIKRFSGIFEARVRPVKSSVIKTVKGEKAKDNFVRFSQRLLPVISEVTSNYENETMKTISTKKGAEDIVKPIQLNQISERVIKEENKKSTYQLSKSKEEKKKIDEGEEADIEEIFNDIIQATTTEKGERIDSKKRYSDSMAKLMGRKSGKFKFFVPPSAEDFMGLIYSFLGKGELGEKQKQFFETHLNAPYKRGVAALETAKQRLHEGYRLVRKNNPEARKKLGKKVPGQPFTYDQAMRVYIWNKQGTDLSEIGLNEKEIAELAKIIESDQNLLKYANDVTSIQGIDGQYPDPGEFWLTENVASDLNNAIDKIGRKKFLEEFIENKNKIFSKDNLNKIEAIYGTNFRNALEDILKRMETGSNRPSGTNKQVNTWLNWINGSVGAIMFLNMRSAILQTISAVNYLNWNDNNPLKAANAFANQKQFWKDFATLYNSDKLKQRRRGTKISVSEEEISNAAASSNNKAKAVLNLLLRKGFTLTQVADSFAIATGGSSMYRNRIKTYEKQGMSTKDAEKAAFEDFSAITEETQQSADPSLISQQQAGPLGRIILAFANTPIQYARLTKKAYLDLANRRGDWKTNLSKIVYYAAIQNIIFSGLQTALFAMAFDDDSDEDEVYDKQLRTFNNMLDSLLRGSGVSGAALAAVKNAISEYYRQEDKEFFADHTYTILQLTGVSPPISSKLRKAYSAIQTNKFEKDVIDAKGFAIDSPIYEVGGKAVSAATNIPLDRLIQKSTNFSEALNNQNKTWERILLALGWNDWDLGIENQEHELIKKDAKDARRKEKYKKGPANKRGKSLREREREKRREMRR